MSQTETIGTHWSGPLPTPSYPFADYRTTPVYPDVHDYSVVGGIVRPAEFAGWKAESLSWKTACYICSGLSGRTPIRYSGPDAAEFLAGICVNGFARFPAGTAKHAIMCDANGLITGHGILQRDANDAFRLFVHGVWANYVHSQSTLRVRQEILDDYLFQVAGPTSLQTLEAAAGTDLHDLGFLRFRPCTIAGRPVEVIRIGMSGGLAYEVHGPMADAREVFDAVVAAGQPHGIQRLGWNTYPVNHVEGGFPQQSWTFFPSAGEDPGFRSWAAERNLKVFLQPRWSGSVDPGDHRARYRTPVEVGWGRSINLDHDFLGRGAVARELADPRRKTVTLVWNADDVVDIYASLFRDGEEYSYINLPTMSHPRLPMAHADHVIRDGVPVGVSSATVYSYYYRQMISLGTIDGDCAEGTEVIVKWGQHGRRIKDVRAVVARFPYYDEQRNQTVDVAAIPSGVSTSRA